VGIRTFVDTNVLVYLFDAADEARRTRAHDVLDDLEFGELVLSTQVLQEFYVTATQKLELEPEVAVNALASLAKNPVVVVDPPVIFAAASRSLSDRLNFWDALIIESALSAGCERLLTEDRGLRPGSTFGSMRVENPFA